MSAPNRGRDPLARSSDQTPGPTARGRQVTAVVEVIGPGGCGKSSLARLLGNGRDGAILHTRLRGQLSPLALATAAARTALPFASQFRRIPSRPWYRYGVMIQLQAYVQLVQRVDGAYSALLLDQGPVYLMSILQRALAGDGAADSRRFRRYWDDQLAFWRRTLRLIVVLDASDALLIDRIRSRGTPHPLLHKTAGDAARKLARGRESRARIMAALRAGGDGPDVLEIDSGALDTPALAAAVRGRLRAIGRG